MKLPFTTLIAVSAFLSSCTVTRQIPVYHHFTNEYEVPSKQELATVKVYHQLDNDVMAVKMVNISDSNYLFNWAKSSIAINEHIFPFAEQANNLNAATMPTPTNEFGLGSYSEVPVNLIYQKQSETVLIPPGQMFESFIQIKRAMAAKGIDLAYETAPLKIQTFLTFSDVGETTFSTNSYTIERLDAADTTRAPKGSNTLVTTKTVSEVDGGATVKGIFLTISGMVFIIAAATSDEPVDE